MLKKITLFVLPLLIAVGAGWFLRTDQDFFVVRDLNVEVEFDASQEALMTSLKPGLVKELENIKGQNIWALGLGQLQKQLLGHPWISEVELSRQFPDKIKTLIRIEKVAFLFVDHKNRIYPVLESGKKLQEVRTSLAPVAPILRNNNILKQPERLQKLLQLYGDIPSIGALKKENIASVDMNSESGLTLKLIKERALVHLGDKDIQTKALRVLRVTDYLQSQKQKARVIDASFPKKVLVRPRKHS